MAKAISGLWTSKPSPIVGKDWTGWSWRYIPALRVYHSILPTSSFVVKEVKEVPEALKGWGTLWEFTVPLLGPSTLTAWHLSQDWNQEVLVSKWALRKGGNAPRKLFTSYIKWKCYQLFDNQAENALEEEPKYSWRCKHFLPGSILAFKARQWYLPMFYVTPWQKWCPTKRDLVCFAEVRSGNPGSNCRICIL